MQATRLDQEFKYTQPTIRPGCVTELGRLIRATVGVNLGRICVVSDEQVWSLYGPTTIETLQGADFSVIEHVVPVGERAKSLIEAERLYTTLAEAHVGRDGLILALGGGVVSDLAGFVAATWLRGIPWVVVPTTVESVVDAAVGGKTGVNLTHGKNLVGAFHAPIGLLVDPRLLRTLPPRDVRAGLAESVKHALLSGEPFLRWHEEHAQQILALDETVIVELIRRNMDFKGGVTALDPREHRLDDPSAADTSSGNLGRAVLNLGHTIGHALELVSEFSWRHGECVALGLLAACKLSQRHAGLDESIALRARRALESLELPVRCPDAISVASVLEALRHDKKARMGRPRFVLLRSLGEPVLCDSISEDDVREVLASELGCSPTS